MFIQEHARQRFPRESEADLRPGARGPPVRVAFDDRAERVHPLRGVVEIGNGLVQPRAREPREALLETAECARGFARLFRRLDHVEGPRVLDQDVRAPVVPAAVDMMGRAVARADEVQALAVGVPAVPAGHRGAQVFRHAHDVLHHRGGIAEDLVVDPLVHEAPRAASVAVRCRVRVVDVARAAGDGVHEFALDGEVAGDGADVVELSGHRTRPAAPRAGRLARTAATPACRRTPSGSSSCSATARPRLRRGRSWPRGGAAGWRRASSR